MSIDRIVRPKEVALIVGVSRSTLWRKVASGNFPKPIQLGENSIGWKLSEIISWIDAAQKGHLTQKEEITR